jgi:amidase
MRHRRNNPARNLVYRIRPLRAARASGGARAETGAGVPAELLQAARARITQVEPQVNAVVIRAEARAKAQFGDLPRLAPTHATAPGWLAGLPVGIKDLALVKGLRATFGNRAMKDYVAPESDPLVERLDSLGGIIVGKTATPEFGAGGNTSSEVFGFARNPWNTALDAGGWSGGAAVSPATGELWLSHGSNLAGSLRTPAALCGVVGLRPTPGRCGGGPTPTTFAPEGIQGPMTRDVRDLALFLDAMAGHHPRQPTTLDAPLVPFQAAVNAPDCTLRIAFAEDQGGFAPVEPEIRAVMRRALEAVQAAGQVVEEACPDLPGLYETYVALRGIHYGSVNAFVPAEVQACFKPTLAQNTAQGRNQTAQDINLAMRQRTVLYQIMREFLQGHGLLAIPVVGIAPGPVEEEYPRFVDGHETADYVDWLRFSFLATTTTLPALSLPVGFTAAGLPVGLQLIGQPRGEAQLLHAARQIEDILGPPCTPIDPIVPR